MRPVFKFFLTLLIIKFQTSVLAQETKNSCNIGSFFRGGENFKNCFILKEDGNCHIFCNAGKAGPIQNRQQPDAEKVFGQTISRDSNSRKLNRWILHLVSDEWKGQEISASSILEHDGVFYVTYTGFFEWIIFENELSQNAGYKITPNGMIEFSAVCRTGYPIRLGVSS
jgi:hypothetical protein